MQAAPWVLLITVYPINIQSRGTGVVFAIFRIYNARMSKTPKSAPKRGRPSKNPAEVKSESILLRLAPSEKEGFGDAAAVAGVPLTVWIRERLRQVAAHELESAKRVVPFLSEPVRKT